MKNGVKTAIFLGITLIFIFGSLILAELLLTKYKEPVRFDILPMSDGVYAIQQNVVSRAPAYNFTSVSVMQTNGQIYTYQGYYFTFVAYDGDPYCVWEDCNAIYSDKLTLYAPIGSLQYVGTVTAH